MLRADQVRGHVPAGFEIGIVPTPHGDADRRPSFGPWVARQVAYERFDYGADIAIAVSAVLELWLSFPAEPDNRACCPHQVTAIAMKRAHEGDNHGT